MSLERPHAEADAVSGPFFEGLADGRLMIQRCRVCGTGQLGRDHCLKCRSEDLAWEAASGLGQVYSFVIMHTVFHPAFAGEVPYNVVMVELDEGPRVLANLEGLANAEIAVGRRVRARLAPGADRLVFEPAD
ncbi:MAG: hypothetical protein JWO33_101 [Caulobacteraceae bacterium]|nr:hypothetical protein [Caulobacteraceae bacterium]